MNGELRSSFFRRRLLQNIGLMLLPLLFLSFASVSIVSSYMEQEAKKQNRTSLTQIQQNIEVVFDELDVLMLGFDSDGEMSKQLREIVHTSQLTADQVIMLRLLRSFVASTANARIYLDSIYVYLDNENDWVLTSLSGLEKLHDQLDMGWYESYLSRRDIQSIWVEPRPLVRYNFQLGDSPNIVTLYRTVRGGRGVIVMNIQPRYFNDRLQALCGYENQRLLILNERDQILFSSSDVDVTELLTSGLLADGDQNFIHGGDYINTVHSERYGLRYISITPLSDLYALPRQLQAVSVVVCIFIALLSVCLAYGHSRNTDRRLKKIYETFDAAINNTPLPPLPSKIDDEYSYITQNLLNTFIQQNYLTVQLNEHHYRLKSMELLALQAQINPHFMVNTLRTIFWKSLALTQGKMNDVSDMIENLTLLLSLSLGSPNETLSVREELKVTCAYISIQKIRFSGRFDVWLDVDEEALDCPILKLILQPLVENAILHAFSGNGDAGIIGIQILFDAESDMLHISISDSGCGIEAEKLKFIQEKLLQNYEDSPEHIGLYNTAKRISLYYSEHLALRIESEVGLGTSIYFDLPANSNSPDE